MPKRYLIAAFAFILPSLLSLTVLAVNPGGDSNDSFAENCKGGRCMMSVDNPKENYTTLVPNPLVVVTDLFGVEYFSKIELLNESAYLWTLGNSEKLSPGVYIITSTSRQNLFKKTLVIQEK